MADYERLAHFAYIPLPGGDRAAKEPWRLALRVLHTMYGEEIALRAPKFMEEIPAGWQLLVQATAAGVNAPLTSSVGRLFDAAAALLDICRVNVYEGQAAIGLELCARRARRSGVVLPYVLEREHAPLTIDFMPVLAALADGVESLSEEERAARALDFHVTMAAAVAEVLDLLAARTGLRTVALSGGVFQNALLLEEMLARLRDFRVLLPHAAPPNDGGIAYGQAAVALARMGM
ncbi:hypothetical protein AXF19_04295 [Selenomonas sp. oral taxon 126]|nr:hypothetical protein AXF19_04295 [Selenomonas sp. oral taxon 126]